LSIWSWLQVYLSVWSWLRKNLSVWNIPKRKYECIWVFGVFGVERGLIWVFWVDWCWFEYLEYSKKEIWQIWVFGVSQKGNMTDYGLFWAVRIDLSVWSDQNGLQVDLSVWSVYTSVFKCLEYSKKGLWLIWVFGVAYVLIWVFEVDSECLEYLIGVDWCWLLLIWVFGTFQKQFMSDVTVLKIHWLFWIWYDRYIQVFSDSHTPRVAGVCVRVRVSASVSA
jgi:hypothetical protein